MSDADLLDALQALLPAQFEKIIYRYGLPPEYLPKYVSQTEQAVALIRYAEQHPGGLQRLSKLLTEVKSTAPPANYRMRSSALAVLALLLVFFIGTIVWQSLEHRQRVAETRRLKEERFDRSPLLEAQQKLTRVWMEQSKFMALISDQVAWRKYVQLVVRQNKLEQDIDLLVEFYKDVYLCLQHRQCDAQSADDYFAADAKQFYCLHQTWIAQRREVAPSYADELQNWLGVKEFADCHPKAP